MSFTVGNLQQPQQVYIVSQQHLVQLQAQQQLQQQLQQSSQLNPYDVAKEFCNMYYAGMITKGYSSVAHMFDQNVACNYCGKEIVGIYNVMINSASEGVSRMAYDKLTYTVLPVNNESISIQVTGLIQGITFWNQRTPTYYFAETFILTLKEYNKIFVTSYSTKLI